MTTLVRHITVWIVAGQVDQTSSWVTERRAEAASLKYSFSAKRHCCVALMIVTVLVLVNDLGGND